ncbi:MAG: protein kinase [Phycisphaerae bacterium]|nr:protein kinase [Phycisphaerae bacterium]
MISASDSQAGGPDDRVTALVEEYVERRRSGEILTPETFAAEHADMAEALRPYLEGLAIVDRVRERASPPVPETAIAETGVPLPEIPGYTITGEIDRGGMGIVYQALQLSTKRVVAIKTLPGGPFAAPAALKRFQREIELAARLQHPAIVRVLESGDVAGLAYYAMDFVDGATLQRYIAETRPEPREILAVFVQICEGVQYAHDRGVIHRDLKPANVLIDAEGKPHILDFGLAKAVDEAGAAAMRTTVISLPGQPMGTLPYLAPEQATGLPETVGIRTDVYALGVMLFEAVAGGLPFDIAATPSEAIRRIAEEMPRRPSEICPAVDRELETIILKAIEKEPSRRYATVHDLGDDLRRHLKGEPILARRSSRFYMARKKVLKHRWRIAAGGAAALMAVVGIWGGTWWSRESAEQARRRGLPEARNKLLWMQQGVDQGKPEEAVAGLERVAAEYPELPEISLVWAQTQFSRPEFRYAAVTRLESELADNPQRWDCRQLLAEMYDWTGQVERAAALRMSSESAGGDTAEDWYLRSFATLDLDRAFDAAVAATQRDPKHALAWQRLAQLAMHTGRLDDGLRAADHLLKLTGNCLVWERFKGDVLTLKGDVQAGLEHYDRLVAAYPNSRPVYRSRAHVYRHVGRYDEAIDDYTRALAIGDPVDKGMWEYYQRATPLWIVGRKEEAIDDMRRVRILRGFPSYSDARLFVLLCNEGRQQEAREVLDAARRDVSDRWLDRIFACLAGEITPAQLVAIAGEDRIRRAEGLYYAGEACLLAGDRDGARAWFHECVHSNVEWDSVAGPLTPMNEHLLARWRLETLTGVALTSAPAGVPAEPGPP